MASKVYRSANQKNLQYTFLIGNGVTAVNLIKLEIIDLR